MSYEKQTWATGDTITAEKLNHMEDGIGISMQIPEDAYIVNLTLDPETYLYIPDKTLSEIVDETTEQGFPPVYGFYNESGRTTIVPLAPVYDLITGDVSFYSYTIVVNIFNEQCSTQYLQYKIYQEDEETIGAVVNTTDTFLPAPPYVNGTYTLKATKTSSSLTYSWVADS